MEEKVYVKKYLNIKNYIDKYIFKNRIGVYKRLSLKLKVFGWVFWIIDCNKYEMFL